MAPECYPPNTHINEKVDIWGSGCILNELCEG